MKSDGVSSCKESCFYNTPSGSYLLYTLPSRASDQKKTSFTVGPSELECYFVKAPLRISCDRFLFMTVCIVVVHTEDSLQHKGEGHVYYCILGFGSTVSLVTFTKDLFSVLLQRPSSTDLHDHPSQIRMVNHNLSLRSPC
jgi:hypothetical protein